MFDQTADVVIVGSGPTGSAYARTIRSEWPEARILMIEAGPQIRPEVGAHLDNIADDEERAAAEMLAQGPTQSRHAPVTAEEWAERRAGRLDASLLRRSGLFVANDGDVRDETFYAGFSAANVGGMGTKWTSGCPVPSDAELPAFIDSAEMSAAIARAEKLLKVDKDLHRGDPVAAALRKKLGAVFDDGRPEARRVQPMPLASTRTADGFLRHGTDVILGPMVDEPAEKFQILTGTACRRVLHDNGVATGVELVRLADQHSWRVGAGTVVVAGDSLHSPQLLFASGIRPNALGRGINDHYLLSRLIEAELDGELHSMSWIPRIDSWPFSVTVGSTHAENFPFPSELKGQLVSIGVFVAADVDPENRVVFDEGRQDWLGLPAISIRAKRTPGDLARIERGKALAIEIAEIIGRPARGFETVMQPVGSSLHYQGTMRMGAADDGNSVCDPTSRVWGFENLHIAGNGLIPTMTATNPTLFSVSLATLGARRIAAERRHG